MWRLRRNPILADGLCRCATVGFVMMMIILRWKLWIIAPRGCVLFSHGLGLEAVMDEQGNKEACQAR
jgi:hypothetical protein